MTYTVGIDFGTESARAVLVDCENGSELAASVHEYSNGVIDERLPAPDTDVELEPDWALQDPADYLRALQSTVPALLTQTEIDPHEVVGVGIDFTSCTMLPTLRDGTPLCSVEDLRREPHAWVKLWKHHAAQPEADRINLVARERHEPWLGRYGGKISSEWFFAKSLQILLEQPEVYTRAERLIDAGDWIVWQLTGSEVRSSCTAGYKAMWSKRDGFPSNAFFAALAPGFERVVDEKMSRTITPIGQRAGGLSEQAAEWTGLVPGTAVAVANVDAHVSAPAVGVTSPGTLVAIMGTSTCHILLGDELAEVAGMCGVVEDGVIAGLYGYEAGQAAVGDLFGWFVSSATPPQYYEQADRQGLDVHGALEREAALLEPGESGLLALDWWNGNRSVLVDADLRGLLVGMTIATRAPEIYRALIEATAFGTRVIIDALEARGLRVESLVACGGLPYSNRLLMQIYADVAGREVQVAGSRQAPALGAAMFGAVAAGRYSSIAEASTAMTPAATETYVPNAGHQKVYDAIYREYVRLHDLFGRGGDDVMRTLKRLQNEARRTETGSVQPSVP